LQLNSNLRTTTLDSSSDKNTFSRLSLNQYDVLISLLFPKTPTLSHQAAIEDPPALLKLSGIEISSPTHDDTTFPLSSPVLVHGPEPKWRLSKTPSSCTQVCVTASAG